MCMSVDDQFRNGSKAAILSQNKEEKAPLPLSSRKRALYICSPSDDNGAFSTTWDAFAARTEVLKNSGFDIDIQQNLNTAEQIAQYIEENYPDGIDYLYFRAHGNPKELHFSNQEGGILFSHLPEEQQGLARRICQAVKEGGVLILETCEAGFGEENILETLASQTRTGVLSIGSQINIGKFSIDNQIYDCQTEYSHELPKHHRYVIDKDSHVVGKDFYLEKDQTRIYYQASSGWPVSIPIKLLDALISFGGTKDPEIFEIYCRFLGEKENFEMELEQFLRQSVDEKSYMSLRDHFSSLQIDPKSDIIDARWYDRLVSFLCEAEQKVGIDRFGDYSLPPVMRSAQLQSDESGIHGIKPGSDPWVRAYHFLLGVAALDYYCDIFSLLGPDKSPSGPLAQCAYALSGLAFHPQFGQTIFESIVSCIETTEISYNLALESGRLKEWINALVNQENPCATAYMATMHDFIAETLTRNQTMEGFCDAQSTRSEEDDFAKETIYADIFSAYSALYSSDAPQKTCDKLLLSAARYRGEEFEKAVDNNWGRVNWEEFYHPDLEKIVEELLNQRSFSSEVLEEALKFAAFCGRNALIGLLVEKLLQEGKMTERGYVAAWTAAAQSGQPKAVHMIMNSAPTRDWLYDNAQKVIDSIQIQQTHETEFILGMLKGVILFLAMPKQ